MKKFENFVPNKFCRNDFIQVDERDFVKQKLVRRFEVFQIISEYSKYELDTNTKIVYHIFSVPFFRLLQFHSQIAFIFQTTEYDCKHSFDTNSECVNLLVSNSIYFITKGLVEIL